MDTLRFGLETGRLVRGALAGLAGGLVFGMLMQMMDMMPMVAGLVGSNEVVVGWVVHLALSAGFGAAFGAFVLTTSYARGVLHGVVWGLVLWLGAAVIVMRAMMGMPIAIDPAAVTSLIGHVAYGLALGLSSVALTRQAAEARGTKGGVGV